MELETASKDRAADLVRRVQGGPFASQEFAQQLADSLSSTDANDPTYAEFFGEFYQEGSHVVTKLKEYLVEFKAGKADATAIQESFRLTHMLKGAAATLGYHFISQVSRSMESLFDAVKHGQLQLDAQVLAIVEDATALIEQNLEEIKPAG